MQRVPEPKAADAFIPRLPPLRLLPEPEEVDVKIEEKDLRIDVFRASGPGGQSVNTTDSPCVSPICRAALPCRSKMKKSQHKNRAKAMQVLRARLLRPERERADSERAADP